MFAPSVAVPLLVLAACGSLEPVHRFVPAGDLRTGVSRPLAESGRGVAIELPPGLSLTTELEGFSEPPGARPSRRFELRITIVDAQRVEPPRATPQPRTAELVDDSGQRFRCRRALVPVQDSATRPPTSVPSAATTTLIFDLPPTYRFRTIVHATVHWELRLDDGTVLPVSSRFRI